MKTHIPGESGFALCGKHATVIHRAKSRYTRGASSPRRASLVFISKNDLVDSATCKACQRADDAKQVRDYKRECAAAGLDPATGRKP